MDGIEILSVEFKSWFDNRVEYFRLLDDGTNWIVVLGDLDYPDETIVKEKASLTASSMDDIVLVLLEFQITKPEIFRVKSYSTVQVADYCEDLFSILNLFEFEDVEDEIYDAVYRPYWSEYGEIVNEFRGSDKFKIVVQDERWVALHGSFGCLVAPVSELRLALENPIAIWKIETGATSLASRLIRIDYDGSSIYVSLDITQGDWPSTHVQDNGSVWKFTWDETTSSDWRTKEATHVYEWIQDIPDRWEDGDEWDLETLKNVDFLKEIKSMTERQSIMVRKEQVYTVPQQWGGGFEDQSLSFRMKLPGLDTKQMGVLKVLARFSPEQLWEIERKIESMKLTGQRFEENGEYPLADMTYSRDTESLTWVGDPVSTSGDFTYFPHSKDLYSVWATSDSWTIEIRTKPEFSAKDFPMELLELMSKLDNNSYLSRLVSINEVPVVEI